MNMVMIQDYSVYFLHILMILVEASKCSHAHPVASVIIRGIILIDN